MVFKRGALGLGYYKDTFNTNIYLASLLPAIADVTPMVLQLDEVVGSKPQGKGGMEEEPHTCPRRKKTRTGRKGIGAGLGLEWPSDDSLAASSTFHRSQGHWAFDTVNGSCWNTTAEYLTQTKADFVAVQETTTLDDSIADTEQAARNKGWKTAMSASISTPPKGNQRGRQ